MFRWTVHLSGVGPDSIFNHTVAVEHKLYYFSGIGGVMEECLNLSIFNTVSLRWRNLPPVTTEGGQRPPEVPCRRRSYSAVLIQDAIYIWGGYPYCNALYAFDVDTHRWFKPELPGGAVPDGREDHSACVLEKVMYVYGGRGVSGYTNDIYKLDTAAMVWSLINTRGIPPPESSRNSANIIGTNMYFNVFEDQWLNRHNTIRVFDTETNCWLSTPFALPEGHWFIHNLAFAYNGELYTFGGQYHKQPFNDMWKFNPGTFSWKKVGTKGKAPTMSECCCIVGDRVILCGGWSTSRDLYVLDLSPSLKALCKLVVIQYGLEQSELPHDIRWELAAMTTKRN